MIFVQANLFKIVIAKTEFAKYYKRVPFLSFYVVRWNRSSPRKKKKERTPEHRRKNWQPVKTHISGRPFNFAKVSRLRWYAEIRRVRADTSVRSIDKNDAWFGVAQCEINMFVRIVVSCTTCSSSPPEGGGRLRVVRSTRARVERAVLTYTRKPYVHLW